MIGHQNVITWISVFCLSLVVNTAQADRVKDLTNVGGVRGNQLVGYGLVVGLAGTGDGTRHSPGRVSRRFLRASVSPQTPMTTTIWRNLGVDPFR